MGTDNALLPSALEYSQEFNCSVIPVNKDKKPLIKWEEFQKRKATRKEIQEWWQQWPDANVGIVTGIISGLAVIDIDEPEEAKPVLDTLIPDSLVIPTAQTPGGGQHLYFKCTDPKLSNNVKVVPGCDLRANGGYIIAPPSMNGNEKGYAWLEGLSLKHVGLPALPEAYVQYLFKHINNNSYSLIENCHAFCHTDGQMFGKGRRDNDLFHVANHLVKSRMPEQEVVQVLEKLALSCNPPFSLKEIPAKIESALKRVTKRDINITEEVERWVSVTDGDFSVTTCVDAVQSVTGVTIRDKSTVRKIFQRLKDRGTIEKAGKKDGVYRRVDTHCEEIDWKNADTTPLSIRYPLGLEKLFRTMQKNIIIVAGAPDAGKTALLLNFIKLNMNKHQVNYFSSEMGASELKDRISKFGLDDDEWKFQAKERAGNFADVIKPDEINIIDFLEIHEDFYRVGGMIKEIFDKLNNGIALIALQKAPGASMGRGGVGSLEKPRLYLSMDNGKVKIEKCKNWAKGDHNPNGLQLEYKLIHGCDYHITRDWYRPLEKAS